MDVTPYRYDILSKKRYPQSELVRLVLVDDKIVIDEKGNLLGRGAYILPKGDYAKALKGGKILMCAFHKRISEEEIVSLIEMLGKKEG